MLTYIITMVQDSYILSYTGFMSRLCLDVGQSLIGNDSDDQCWSVMSELTSDDR